MASYSWASTTTGGEWTDRFKWSPNTSYPQLEADVATGSLNGPNTININLGSNISLGTLRTASSSSSGIAPINITGSATINFSGLNSLINAVNGSFPTISARVATPSNVPLRMEGLNTRFWTLKNTTNSIYQIRVSGTTAVGFDSVSCLGIQHPDYVFARGTVSDVYMICTASGGTLAKSLWDGGGLSGTFRPFSNGTGPFKLGVSGVTVPLTGLFLNGTLLPQSSDSADNELSNNFSFTTATSISKQGACRWILSGSVSGTVSSISIADGVLQIPVSQINAGTYTQVNPVTSSNSCFEISGSGTVRSTLSVNVSANIVGYNRIGAVRAASNSNINISRITLNGNNKLAAATNATLTIPNFTNPPSNQTIFFGGEGTIDLQYALTGTSTSVSITKEDSGTLLMSTNDKTYTAPTNINGGTVLCDGVNRISQSTLVTVANGARLRANYTGIQNLNTVLSLKALTLNSGSVIQVG